jgi:type VI secretion system protein ImpA
MGVPMSPAWNLETLLAPISEQQPCGEDLEYTLLPALDAFRVFGSATGYEDAPDWGEVQNRALEALKKSKDVRALAHLGAASIRTEGLVPFSWTLAAAASWLDSNWEGTYPLVDEDAMVRRNALNCFADPIATIDGLRRAPLVAHRQHGRFSLRDIEIASGQVSPAQDEARADEAQIGAAFAAIPFEDLQGTIDCVGGLQASIRQIDQTMRERGGGDEAAPGFEPLVGLLGRMAKVLATYRAARPEAAVESAQVEGEGDEGGAPAGVPGTVRSREDAVRVLDSVAEFFRRTEPSSPVPLFLDRAKRLVSKDFLEVLADIAPDALPQARSAGGVRDE